MQHTLNIKHFFLNSLIVISKNFILPFRNSHWMDGTKAHAKTGKKEYLLI